jgi:hypothetical protein
VTALRHRQCVSPPLDLECAGISSFQSNNCIRDICEAITVRGQPHCASLDISPVIAPPYSVFSEIKPLIQKTFNSILKGLHQSNFTFTNDLDRKKKPHAHKLVHRRSGAVPGSLQHKRHLHFYMPTRRVPKSLTLFTYPPHSTIRSALRRPIHHLFISYTTNLLHIPPLTNYTTLLPKMATEPYPSPKNP